MILILTPVPSGISKINVTILHNVENFIKDDKYFKLFYKKFYFLHKIQYISTSCEIMSTHNISVI